MTRLSIIFVTHSGNIEIQSEQSGHSLIYVTSLSIFFKTANRIQILNARTIGVESKQKLYAEWDLKLKNSTDAKEASSWHRVIIVIIDKLVHRTQIIIHMNISHSLLHTPYSN